MDRVDPRVRLITALLFCVVVAVANSRAALGTALLVSFLGAVWVVGPAWKEFGRLVPINGFVLMLALLLVFVEGGPHMAAAIALKANALVLGVMALLGTLSNVTLAHALGHLGAPLKFTQLLLFTIRYLDVLRREYHRLRGAMRIRAFRPGMNGHTYRAFGYLVGTLLVRSLDRSERVVAAMKCRGFTGHFSLLDHFAFSVHDVWFSLAAALLLSLLAVLEFA